MGEDGEERRIGFGELDLDRGGSVAAPYFLDHSRSAAEGSHPRRGRLGGLVHPQAEGEGGDDIVGADGLSGGEAGGGPGGGPPREAGPGPRPTARQGRPAL